MIHIQHKNIQLLSANTDKHSYDSNTRYPFITPPQKLSTSTHLI